MTSLKTNKPIILLGFPGVGKTEFCKQFKAHDSDSSSFSWLSPGVRHPDFPNNYIAHLETLDGVVLASSHEVVRKALQKKGIPYGLVYPTYSCKEEYMLRYAKRGSPQTFIDLLSKNWEYWINELIQDRQCNFRITMTQNEYLTDFQDLIERFFTKEWVEVKLDEIGNTENATGVHPDAIKSVHQYQDRNGTMGAEYGVPDFGKSQGGAPTRMFQIRNDQVCCHLKDFVVKKDNEGRDFIYAKALPIGNKADEIYTKLKADPDKLKFAMRGLVEKGIVTHILSWDLVM